MSAKHTPGPWHWDSDPIKGDPLDRVRYRVVTTGKTITQCYYSSGDAHAEHDARLIDAAPELLLALEDALAIFGPEDGEAWTAPNWAARASAAIAKATGSAE